MAHYTSSDMTKPRTSAGQAPAQAPQEPARQQNVRVPPGGQVTIRKATNGVIATVTGADWRDQGQVLAESASDLKIE